MPKTMRGNNLAELLCHAAYDYAERTGRLVRPTCPYVRRRYLVKHPERAAFNAPVVEEVKVERALPPPPPAAAAAAKTKAAVEAAPAKAPHTKRGFTNWGYGDSCAGCRGTGRKHTCPRVMKDVPDSRPPTPETQGGSPKKRVRLPGVSPKASGAKASGGGADGCKQCGLDCKQRGFCKGDTLAVGGSDRSSIHAKSRPPTTAGLKRAESGQHAASPRSPKSAKSFAPKLKAASPWELAAEKHRAFIRKRGLTKAGATLCVDYVMELHDGEPAEVLHRVFAEVGIASCCLSTALCCFATPHWCLCHILPDHQALINTGRLTMTAADDYNVSAEPPCRSAAGRRGAREELASPAAASGL